jgi:hypothetical protein
VIIQQRQRPNLAVAKPETLSKNPSPNSLGLTV